MNKHKSRWREARVTFKRRFVANRFEYGRGAHLIFGYRAKGRGWIEIYTPPSGSRRLSTKDATWEILDHAN